LTDHKPIGAALNRNLGSPTAPGEAVEAELNRLIERRSRRKDPDEESDGRQHASSGISTTRRRLNGSDGPWRA
jgi:hypothetical protein